MNFAAHGGTGAASGSGTVASLSPTSPVSIRSHGGTNGAAKRKRSHGGLASTMDSSPGSVANDDDHDHHDKKRQPGVKRACNECRQQKLRCDVVQDPFQSCSRCCRLKLDCKIESNFKRVGKRSKHAEMEREIEKLRRSVGLAKSQGYVVDNTNDDDDMESHIQSPVVNNVYSHTRHPSLMGSEEAVSSLLHLKRGGSYSMARVVRTLEQVYLTDEAETALFHEFWNYYHPFLPFLHPEIAPETYYSYHPLLYWTIVYIAARRYRADQTLLPNLTEPLQRLLWKTIGDVPGSHHIVKAMCLLCSWPIVTSSSSTDITHILCGVMMKTATGIGLHRPNHINDFTRVAVELNNDQLHDRIVTWAVCNIVAQNVATGYGQPASTLYDWTLATRPGESGPFQLSAELEARLRIERFCDKVSKEMYSNVSDSRGVAGDEHRSMLMRVFRRDYSELHADIMSRGVSSIVTFHLKAASLHLRLAGFFDSCGTNGYIDDLKGLWNATINFLDEIITNDQVSSPETPGSGITIPTLSYATNYLQQMIVAAGFVLLKLMRSFFSRSLDMNRGRHLFHRTISAIRATSVNNGDLQSRLAELMVQMWNGARLDTKPDTSYTDEDSPHKMDDSLQLKVRCRHSMSLVFDSIWHWREEYEARGRGTLDALKPTHPDSANESSASSTHHMDTTLAPPSQGLLGGFLSASNGALTPNAASGQAASSNGGVGSTSGNLMGSLNYDANPSNYDFFDLQAWSLDNLVDFNYTNAYANMQPMEGT